MNSLRNYFKTRRFEAESSAVLIVSSAVVGVACSQQWPDMALVLCGVIIGAVMVVAIGIIAS